MSRLNFTKKAYGEFIGEAIASLESAKSIHDDLVTLSIKHLTESQTTNTTETIDSNSNSHVNSTS